MVVYTHMEIAPNHPCHFRSFHENHGQQVNKCKWSTFLLGYSHRKPPRRETHLRCLSGDVCKMATSCCRSQRIPAWRLPLRWATHLVNWFVNGLEWYCNITMTIYHDWDILGYVEGYFIFSLGYIYISHLLRSSRIFVAPVRRWRRILPSHGKRSNTTCRVPGPWR